MQVLIFLLVNAWGIKQKSLLLWIEWLLLSVIFSVHSIQLFYLIRPFEESGLYNKTSDSQNKSQLASG